MSQKPTIDPEYFENLVNEGMSRTPRDVRLQVILDKVVDKIEGARKKGVTHASLVLKEDEKLSPELIRLLEDAIDPVRLSVKNNYYDDDDSEYGDAPQQKLDFDWGPIDVSSPPTSKCIII